MKRIEQKKFRWIIQKKIEEAPMDKRAELLRSLKFLLFSVSAGIRFSDVWRDFDGEISADEGFPYVDYTGRKLYPDFHLSYEAIPEKLVLSAKVIGGQRFNTYGSYLRENHHFSMYNSSRYSSFLGDATVNTFDAGIGLSGRVRSIFQYGAEASPLNGLVLS